jgi:ABC-type dipeptide/oligopeptide/nickel transport system permease component
MKIISGIVAVCLALPIGLWLQYQVLKRVDASELMFFLFWVHVPVLIFIQIMTKLLEKSGD